LLTLIRSPIPWRVALPVYALVLAVATHWPRLVIEGPVARSDLYIHVAAFFVLGGLLGMAALFGRAASPRNLAFAWFVGVGFAGLDELTQAIPAIGRTAGWDDFLADIAGVTLGLFAAGAVARLAAAPTQPGTSAEM
jgi:VanZ family protein